jgi:hypothetical protein
MDTKSYSDSDLLNSKISNSKKIEILDHMDAGFQAIIDKMKFFCSRDDARGDTPFSEGTRAELATIKDDIESVMAMFEHACGAKAN